MTIALVNHLSDQPRLRIKSALIFGVFARRLRASRTQVTLTLLSALLLCASLGAYNLHNSLLGGRNIANSCRWYTIESGDTLSSIAWHYHITISKLASANTIANINLIFVGQRLCVPHRRFDSTSGITDHGAVRWYAYNALGWSSRSQVRHMLCETAIRHHLPSRLLLAIAWQESGWTQHVIAHDGGIGVMQLMPYTAMGINTGIGQLLDPYDLQDNLDLGATYLQWLWQNFHGNLPQIISSYNEGGWAVKHRGIFNWHYVNNVMALMHNLN
ncbi:MAG TPA: transglycosylase SLT domain-containing protein [Ktedonobacteraceae bacterium]